MKIKNVIFSKNSIRIVNGDYLPKDNEKVLINPIYPKGVSPNHWKLEDNKIVEMTDEEKQKINNKHKLLKIENKIKDNKKTDYLKIILISLGSSLVLNILFKALFS